MKDGVQFNKNCIIKQQRCKYMYKDKSKLYEYNLDSMLMNYQEILKINLCDLSSAVKDVGYSDIIV